MSPPVIEGIIRHRPEDRDDLWGDQNKDVVEVVTLHEWISRLVESLWFDIVMGAIISLNAVSIAVEQSFALNGQDTTAIRILESFFLVIYIAELGGRFLSHGMACLRDHWVKFDAFLVVLGVVTSWIIEPWIQGSPNGIGLLMVGRTARLLRLGKTARLLTNFHEFWMLMRGFMNSLGLMFFSFITVFMLLYVFSCLGVELITKHSMNMGPTPDPEFQAHVREYFPNFLTTLRTLIRFVTLDQMSDVYTLLIDKEPLLSIYFTAIIIIVGIVLMNLVSAVILSTTMDKNREEEQAMKKAEESDYVKFIHELREMFNRLDEDNSGVLSRHEIRRIKATDNTKLMHALEVTSPVQIFDALDIDKTGTVSIADFFDSILDVGLKKSPVDLKRMEKQVANMVWRAMETLDLQRTISTKLNNIEASLQAADEAAKEAQSSSAVRGSSGSLAVADLPPWAQNLIGKLERISEESWTTLNAAETTSMEESTATIKSTSDRGGPVRQCNHAKVSKQGAENRAYPTTSKDHSTTEGKAIKSLNVPSTPLSERDQARIRVTGNIRVAGKTADPQEAEDTNQRPTVRDAIVLPPAPAPFNNILVKDSAVNA